MFRLTGAKHDWKKADSEELDDHQLASSDIKSCLKFSQCQ